MNNRGRSQEASKPTRTPHRKVRTGCAVCKRRRIKCDEGKPGCQNCLLFSVDCTYSSSRLSALPARGEQLRFIVNHGPGPHRERGRPRTKWPERVPPTAFQVPLPYTRLSMAVPSLAEGLRAYSMLLDCLKWAGDIPTMESREQIIRKTPSTMLGMSCPVILDLVRSVVTSHLAQQLPQYRHHFRTLADGFSSAGIRRLAMMLPCLNTENAHAVFAAAVLVCATVLAYGPRPGEYLFFNSGGSLTWIQLFKGLKSIPDTVGVNKVFSGPLRNFLCGIIRVDRPAIECNHFQALGWAEQLSRLREFVSDPANDHWKADTEALDSLELCYEANWGRADGSYAGNVMNSWALIWAYRLQDGFVHRLQNKSPIPLVILAHFAVVFKTQEHVWFVAGWPQHILMGIHAVIDQVYLPWLEWPTQALAILS